VGVYGQTNRGQVGGQLLGLDGRASGRAGVGAEATADGALALGPQGLRARLAGEAFAGARASGEVPVGFSLLGVRFGATGRGNVSAGAGISGHAHGQIGNGGVRCGADLSGCLGVGAGLGLDLEIDATGLINFFSDLGSSGGGYSYQREDFRPRIVGEAGPGLVRVSTVNCIGSRCTQLWTAEQAQALRDRDRNEYESLSAFFAQPRTGNQANRFSNTRMSDAELYRLLTTPPAGNARQAAGAGQAGALGR
jgi:hypothetical protein